MEGFWQRAKDLAEETMKKSQSLTPSLAKITDLVFETTKRSMEFAAQASKTADLLKSAAIKHASHIKSLSADFIVVPSSEELSPPDDLLRFGITDDHVDFVRGLTSTTF